MGSYCKWTTIYFFREVWILIWFQILFLESGGSNQEDIQTIREIDDQKNIDKHIPEEPNQIWTTLDQIQKGGKNGWVIYKREEGMDH